MPNKYVENPPEVYATQFTGGTESAAAVIDFVSTSPNSNGKTSAFYDQAHDQVILRTNDGGYVKTDAYTPVSASQWVVCQSSFTVFDDADFQARYSAVAEDTV